jgi:hypothetical protein
VLVGARDEQIIWDINDPPRPHLLGSHWEAVLSDDQFVWRAAPLSEGSAGMFLVSLLLVEGENLVVFLSVCFSYFALEFEFRPVRLLFP